MNIFYTGLALVSLGLFSFVFYVSRVKIFQKENIFNTFRNSFLALTAITLLTSLGLLKTIKDFGLDGQLYAALLTNVFSIPVAFAGALVVILLAENQNKITEKQRFLEESQFKIEMEKDFQTSRSIAINLSNKSIAAREAISEHIWMVCSRTRALFTPNDGEISISDSIYSSRCDEFIDTIFSEESGSENISPPNEIVFQSTVADLRINDIVQSFYRLQVSLDALLLAIQDFSVNSICARAYEATKVRSNRQELCSRIKTKLAEMRCSNDANGLNKITRIENPDLNYLMLEFAQVGEAMKLTLLKCGDANSKESFVREAYFRSWERVQKMTTVIDTPDIASGHLTAHGNLALPTQFLRDQELVPCDDQSNDEIVSQNGVYFIYNRISALLYSAENIIPSGCDFEIAMQSIYGMAAYGARDFEISTLHNELASRYFNLEESLVEGGEARFLAYS